MVEAAVLFGVAGWSYPDWKDVVYPRNCRDTLRAVAERVDLIEINNTFYRPPSSKNCRAPRHAVHGQAAARVHTRAELRPRSGGRGL
jgi:uncharacterized protein YecE (DUF72 family)